MSMQKRNAAFPRLFAMMIVICYLLSISDHVHAALPHDETVNTPIFTASEYQRWAIITRADYRRAGYYNIYAQQTDKNGTNEKKGGLPWLLPLLDDKVSTCTENSVCSPEAYCAKKAGYCTGEGTCTDKPVACPDLWDPVCGCDGHTYGNNCDAAAAGVNVDYEGECTPKL